MMEKKQTFPNSSCYKCPPVDFFSRFCLKGALCSFGEDILIRRATDFVFYVADPAFLASISILGMLFSSENSLFIHLRKKKIHF